jgi:hypothetical protein
LPLLGRVCAWVSDTMPGSPSGKLLETHSIGSIFDHNLGVFTVTKIALENTNAAPPAHPVSGTKAGC